VPASPALRAAPGREPACGFVERIASVAAYVEAGHFGPQGADPGTHAEAQAVVEFADVEAAATAFRADARRTRDHMDEFFATDMECRWERTRSTSWMCPQPLPGLRPLSRPADRPAMRVRRHFSSSSFRQVYAAGSALIFGKASTSRRSSTP
jgi:hypothetical protein